MPTKSLHLETGRISKAQIAVRVRSTPAALKFSTKYFDR